MTSKRLNFNTERQTIRMNYNFDANESKIDKSQNDYKVKHDKDAFMITQEELERQPGYIKPIAPKRLT